MMTNDEAIKWIEYDLDDATSEDYFKAHCMAIAALEKQIPRNPNGNYDNLKCNNGHFIPVSCKNSRMKYCPMCGQKIDWSDEDDE